MGTTIILILSFLNLCAVSQKSDPKAVALLEEVSAKAKASKSIKVEFLYSMENKKANINEEKSGTLLLSGDKYRMSVAGQIVICDGKTLWTWLKESNEVQINTLEEKDDAMTPSKLLTSYNANFKSKILKSQEPGIESVELLPNASKTFTKAILGIDKAKKQISSFRLFDKSGNTFTYKIKSYQTDVPVSISDFTFDAKKNPGVEIIDMR